MTRKRKTRDVDKALYINYLKKAQECFHAAKSSFGREEWNAAVINAIHASIAGCDAMCVYFLGKRHAGDSHEDAVLLFKTILSGKESTDVNASRLARILSIKTTVEYEDRLASESEADKVLRDCERFLEYVQKELPR